MENTYWSGKGRYQAEFDEIIKLMPGMGNSDVLAGELIRAANRLAYDFYNNGMGNNTSGAINFLAHHGAVDPGVRDTIQPYTTGRLYHGDYEGDALQLAIEAMIDSTVEMIVRNPQLMTMKNTDDIFNYEDPAEYFDEEDEYEEEDEYSR
jgi:hypothetical protein